MNSMNELVSLPAEFYATLKPYCFALGYEIDSTSEVSLIYYQGGSVSLNFYLKIYTGERIMNLRDRINDVQAKQNPKEDVKGVADKFLLAMSRFKSESFT